MTSARDPLLRLLTPPPEVPEYLTRVHESLRLGLPHRLTLTRDLRLLLIVSVGVASPWRSADAFASVSSSAPHLAALAAAEPPPSAPGARLLIEGGSQLPLVAGLVQRVASPIGELELAITGWDIRAGTVRGPGDFGSWLEVAWAPAAGPDEVFTEREEA